MQLLRVITPKRMVGIDPNILMQEVEKGIRETTTKAINEFKKPVRQWDGKPTFVANTDVWGGDIKIQVVPVGPHADKFGWIDNGVAPRLITARNKPFLRFRRNYSASTSPGSLTSRRAKRSGGFVRKKSVHWGGIRARGFSHQVYRIVNPEFRRQMENAIRRAITRTRAKGVS